MWAQYAPNEKRSGDTQGGPPRQGFAGSYPSRGPPTNPPPPVRPPAQQNLWTPPRQQVSHENWGHSEDNEDEGALGATINLVTSAASMFFKPAAPAPPPPPPQHTTPSRSVRGPPPPIDPTTSMLDMEPMSAAPPAQTAYSGASLKQGFRPPSQPPTPSTGRSINGTPSITSSPRLFEPSSPKALATTSPKIAKRIATPQITVPSLGFGKTSENQPKQSPAVLPAIPPSTTAPPLKIGTSTPKESVTNVFAFGSAPSTPASAASTPNAASMREKPPISRGSTDASNVFGVNATSNASNISKSRGVVNNKGSAPPTPSRGGDNVTASAETPSRTISQPAKGVPTPSRQPSQPPVVKNKIQRATPPPSPKPQYNGPPSPVTPLMTNQTSSASKADKVTPVVATSSPSPTPTRRQLRAPPKAKPSPRNNSRPKFRLPPPRKKISPSPLSSDKPATAASKSPAITSESPPTTPLATVRTETPQSSLIRQPPASSPKSDGPPILPSIEQTKKVSTVNDGKTAKIDTKASASEKTAPEFTTMPKSEKLSDGLPEGWKEAVDSSSGTDRVYYYNTITQETSWERPKGQESESVKAVPVSEKNDEVLYSDDTTTKEIRHPEELNAQAGENEIFKPETATASGVGTPAPETEISREESIDSILGDLNAEFGLDTHGDKKDSLHNKESDKIMNQPVATDADYLPQDWVESHDASSGRTYYFNTVTQESSWEKPTCTSHASPTKFEENVLDTINEPAFKLNEAVSPIRNEPEHVSTGEEAAISSLPADWVEATDPSSGNTYYYNTVTQETSWERPMRPLEETPADFPSEAIQTEATSPEVVAETNIEKPIELMEKKGDLTASEEVNLRQSTHESSSALLNDSVPEQVASETSNGLSLVTMHEAKEHPERVAPPSMATADTITDTPNQPTSDWVEVLDETTGSNYYYNTITQETSWEKPIDFAENEVDTAAAAEEPEAMMNEEAIDSTRDSPTLEDESTGDDELNIETNRTPSSDSIADEGDDLPQDWVETIDQSTGQVYYYNVATQETSWEKPEPLGQRKTKDLAPEDVMNETTRVQQPDSDEMPSYEPEKVGSIDAVAMDPGDSSDDTMHGELPPDWVEAIDESSGRPYYYNTVTQETSWEKPIASDMQENDHDPSATCANEENVTDGIGNDVLNSTVQSDGKRVEPETEESSAVPMEETPDMDRMTSQVLPKDWVEMLDDSSGRIFYYNAVTNETSWEKPTNQSEIKSEKESPLAETDEHTEDNYDHASSPKNLSEEYSSEIDVNEETNCDLPEDWEEMLDESSGQKYYFNRVTQETSWDVPIVAASDTPSGEVTEDTFEAHTVALVGEVAKVDANDEPSEEPEMTEAIISKQNLPEKSIASDEDWVEAVDESSGQTYYFNTVTQETVWERPTSMKKSTPELPEELEPGDDKKSSELLSPDATLVLVRSDRLAEKPESSGQDSTATSFAGDKNEHAGCLPPDWEEVFDQSSGQVYYYNSVTHESSWEKPQMKPEMTDDTGLQMDDMTQEIASDRAPVPTESSVNDEAEDTAPPSNPDSDVKEEAADKESLSPEWIEAIEESSGKVYFYNTETGKTSWEKPQMTKSESSPPEDGGMGGSTSPDEDQTVGPDTINDLPMNWVDAVDESTGETYYYNTVTEEISWEKPSLGNIEVPSAETTGGVALDEKLPEHSATMEKPLLEVDEGINIGDGEGNGPSDQLPDASGATVQVFDQDVYQNWEEVVDESSGQIYYYNAITDETSWEKPTAGPAVARGASGSVGEDPDEATPDEIPSAATEDAVEDEIHPSLPTNTTSELAEDWIELIDGSSGKVYYYNTATQETSWEKPEPELSAEPDNSEAPESNANAEAVDSDEPLDTGADAEPELLEEDSPEVKDVAVLPADWQEVVDESTGQVYYYNVVTQETSWEKPSEAPQEELDNIEPEDAGEDTDAAPDDEDVDVDVPVPDEAEMLPEDWAEVVDESSGQVYYYNSMTQETSWEKPSSFPIESNKFTDVDKDESTGIKRAESKDEFLDEYELATAEEEKTDKIKGEEFANEFDVATDDEDDFDMVVTDDNQVEGTDNNNKSGTGGLPEFWTEAVDESSGRKYYFNTLTKETSWEPPPIEPENDEKPLQGGDVLPVVGKANDNNSLDENQGSIQDGWVNLGKEGKKSVRQVEPPSDEDLMEPRIGKTLLNIVANDLSENIGKMPRASNAALEKAFDHLNTQREQFKILGPLVVCSDSLVLDYITSKTSESPEDILWQLIAIAAASNGRLRSDEGVANKFSPETAIVELLLREGPPSTNDLTAPNLGTTKIVVENIHDEDDVQASMERIQNLLLRGRRRQAVDAAIASRDFATALLVASMCDTQTYKKAARAYAERVFVAGSPMQTLSMLFSGGLQTAAGTQGSHWGVNSRELKSTWKKHLAAIISNRTIGWDHIVLSLGDRLREVGDINAAHFCYMVCGCPFTNPTAPDSRIALLGSDHHSAETVCLMTDKSILAYDRTEAYEWAKRRGNKNATIHNFLPHKLIYAMHLTDIGQKEKAVLVVEAIRQNSDIWPGSSDGDTQRSLKALFTNWDFLCSALAELEDHLGCGQRVDVRTERISGSVPGAEKTAKATTEKQRISLEARFSNVGNTGELPRKEEHFGDAIDNHSLNKVQDPVVVDNETERTSHIDRDVDVSFMTARTNLMEVTGYSMETPERPPKVNQKNVDFTSASPPIAAPVVSNETAQKSIVPEARSAPAMDKKNGPSTAIPPFKTSHPAAATQRGVGSSIGGAPPLGMPSSPALANTDKPIKEKPAKKPQNIAPTQEMMTPKEPKTGSGRPKSPPATAPPVMMGRKSDKKKEKEAPSSSGKPSSGSSWGLGIREWMVKKLNPDATQITLPDNEEKAYFDDKLGRWVFPGDDPAELAKPLPPPPKIPAASAMSTTPTPAPIPSNDPLAQLMAPPPVRGLPSARRPGSAPRIMTSPGAFPSMPGMASPTPRSSMTPAAGAAPPTFAVFTPKPTEKDEKKSD